MLKRCGDNLTRENVMKIVANLDFEINTYIPGIHIKTTPTDFYPIEQVQMMSSPARSGSCSARSSTATRSRGLSFFRRGRTCNGDLAHKHNQNIGISRAGQVNPEVKVILGRKLMDRTLERSTMRKVYLRLLPFAVLSYVLAYIDRINVSFAGLTMRDDLGMSAGTFGFAVGMFYWGYFLFEVPSNVILEKVGARIWIARIMITWGILAGATAMVTGSTSFAIVRFLLGVAEAGFFPGIILYFTYWFPSHHHARIVSGFLVGLPIAVAVGAPISTGLLGLDGLFGLKGWQVMYIAEAIPTVVIGVLTYFVLTDRPEQAKFLTAEERNWLVDEDRRRAPRHRGGAQIHAVGGDVQSQGAAAGAELSRHRHRQPRHADFHSANHQVARQLQQHDGRLAHHDPLYLRRHRHGGVGTHLRPHERAALESVHRPACSRPSASSSPA